MSPSPKGDYIKEEKTMENAMNTLWLEAYRKIEDYRKLKRKLEARYDKVKDVEQSARFQSLDEEKQDKVYDYLYELNKKVEYIDEAIDEIQELIDKIDSVEVYMEEMKGIA